MLIISSWQTGYPKFPYGCEMFSNTASCVEIQVLFGNFPLQTNMQRDPKNLYIIAVVRNNIKPGDLLRIWNVSASSL
jgi:hypothetical protein